MSSTETHESTRGQELRPVGERKSSFLSRNSNPLPVVTKIQVKTGTDRHC